MECPFSSCTRYRDRAESQFGRGPLEWLKELNLDVSTEALFNAERAFTYADLYAMLDSDDTIVWMTPDAAVVRATGRASVLCLETRRDVTRIFFGPYRQQWAYRFVFSADGKEILALAHSPEHLLEICGIVVRLLAASVVHSVLLRLRSSQLRNTPSLASLMEHCQSLKILALRHLEMDENDCRVFGDYSRPGLEIELEYCRFEGAAAEAMAEVLGRNQGPTNLSFCDMDNSVLADGLRGNSRLKSLSLHISGDVEASNQAVHAIADALRENKGLLHLDFHFQFSSSVSDEAWNIVCNSLKTHPTLQVLSLLANLRGSTMASAKPKSRIQALVDMLKVNNSMHTIHLDPLYTEHELFQQSVLHYLVTNRLRSRLLAIQKSRPMAYRARVLGRALLSARTDANSFWMLLSGNAEVAFPPRTTSIAAATDLPTSTAATAAATSTTSAAAITDSVMYALTTTPTGSVPTAAAAAATSAATPSTTSADTFASTAAATVNVATPSTDQKRKVRS
jgi:hypothetical protein